MQKLPNHRHKKAGRKSPIVDVSNFLSLPGTMQGHRSRTDSGKNTGRLLSEASISDKKTELPVSASLR